MAEVDSETEREKLLRLGGPDTPFVVLVRREGWLLIPTGATRLFAGDELYVLGAHESMEEMRARTSAS